MSSPAAKVASQSARRARSDGFATDDPSGIARPVLTDVERGGRHELRRDVLADLFLRFREASDPDAVCEVAARSIGRALSVDRAGYARVDDVSSTVVVDRDWSVDPSFPSFRGEHRFDDFGTYFPELRSGRTVAVADVREDPRTSPKVRSWTDNGVVAMLNVPLLESGRIVALFFLNSTVPRTWTEEEVAFVRDVTDVTWAARERLRAEADLRALNATLEARVVLRTRERDRAWRLSKDLLAVVDEDGILVATNAAWTSHLAWDESDLLDTPFLRLVHPMERDLTRAAFASVVLDGWECRLRHRDGTYPWFSWTAAFEDGFFYVSGRSTNGEREQADALAVAEERLRQSSKMEAVGQLTGGVSHDFNNLLTGITGNLDLLARRLAQGRFDEVDRYLSSAQDAVARASALTHRLLAFSRMQKLDPARTDVGDLVDGMADMIRRTVGPSIDVVIRGDHATGPTLLDRNQLENALLNLCINARDAMPSGGVITIETGDVDVVPEGGDEPVRNVFLSVSDTGTGMTSEVASKAFDPFFTTKPVGMGTGLGLSMIYGFAKQSGGQATIRSEPGRGTTVTLCLPRRDAPLAPETVPVGFTSPCRVELGAVALVVDDERSVRSIVVEVLEDMGYAVLQAPDGAGGLSLLQSAGRVDLLVTDIGLPGAVDGREVARVAKSTRPDVQVLFITGYADVSDEAPSLRERQVLAKPFTVQELTERIAALSSGDPP